MRPDLAAAADHVEWAVAFGWGGRIAVVVMLAATVALAAWNVRTLASKRRRAALLGLRLATAAALGLVIAQPTWVSKVEHAGGRRVAVLVDASASMAQVSAGARRWDAAARAVTELARLHPVDVHTFGTRTEHVGALAGLQGVLPDQAHTDLVAALGSLVDTRGPRGIAAAVVISDGLDTEQLAVSGSGEAPPLDSAVTALIERLRVPVHAVFIGDRAPVRDVAVVAARAAPFGFTRTFMPLDVDIEVSGYGGRREALTVTVADNGRPVLTREVPLDGPPRRTVSFEFQPLHVGVHVIEATIAALPDEATAANNHAWAGLRVVRDRLRVLHLAGHPSWDTRFLRLHLRGSPAVDLVSFYVMVGQGAGAYVSADDTTLIPFPNREIFEESLTSFDLVIFQDFPLGPFQVEQYLPQLREYVVGGGAFLVVGGRQALAAGGYYGTPLAQWLPVRLASLAGDDVGYVDAATSLALTPAGQHHPVTALESGVDANAAAWTRRTLAGRNTALAAGEGGSVLVTDQGGHPVIAVGEVGEGRSAVIGTDSLWTWAFPPTAGSEARDETRTHYHRLLDQLTAWLLHDPDLDRVRIEVPVDPVDLGSAALVRVQVRGGDGAVLPNVLLRYGLAPLHEPQVEPAQWSPPLTTNEQGDADLRIQPPGAGLWLLTVEASIAGQPVRATAPLGVDASGRERASCIPDDRALAAVARAAGGKVWPWVPPRTGVPIATAELADGGERIHTDLWSHPAVLTVLVALLGAEWVLRRRWGLA